MREMVFISHANPEDNEFALWLALRLAAEGYPVWCDLTRLLGGEDFWTDIEAAIRERSAKFLFVLSKTSNSKSGPLAELQVARNVERDERLKDFVIPLLVDDLPPRQSNILIARTNAIFCNGRWAEGLSQLLQKLEEDAVSKSPQFGPESVKAWWRKTFDPSEGVRWEADTLASNWYPILKLPALRFHELHRETPGSLDLPRNLPYPAVQHNQFLLTFADADCFRGMMGPAVVIAQTHWRTIGEPIESGSPRLIDDRDERRRVADLLRQAWDRLIDSRTVPTYTFADKARAFYFRKGFVPDDRISFRPSDGGRASHRQVVGYKTIGSRAAGTSHLRYWHFALQAKPQMWPVLGFVFKSHVLFSDDGDTIWENKDKLHRARRSQCSNWWNADWRDRQLAAAAWLSDGGATIQLPVSPSASIEVSALPYSVTAPVSFDEHEGLVSEEAQGDTAYDEEDLEEIDSSFDSDFAGEGE